MEFYGFATSFERVVATLCASRPSFANVVLLDLDFPRVEDVPSRALIVAAQEHFKVVGHGPVNPVLVVQHLRAKVTVGKMTLEELNACIDVLNDTLIDDLDDASVVAELLPVMRRVMQKEVAISAIEASGKASGFAEVKEMIHRAESLGTADRSIGVNVQCDVLKTVLSGKKRTKLPIGILELDVILEGGLGAGNLGIFAAPEKTGKSAFLTGVIANALEHGLFVLEATTELTAEDQFIRLVANMTGVPVAQIIDGSWSDKANDLFNGLLPFIGQFIAKKFEAGSTNVQHIREWVAACEKEKRRKCDLLVVDYLDEITSVERLRERWERDERAVKELHHYTQESGMYVWTASQVKGGNNAKSQGKRIFSGELSGSQGKGRVCDLLITGTKTKEGLLDLFIAGSRHAEGDVAVGPFPMDLARARIVAR